MLIPLLSLSLVTLWRQKGQSEDGWPKKTLVHRRVTGATASKPGRGPSSSGWVVDEPLKVELLAMLWPRVRSAGRVSPCAPAGHALATLGREPAPRRDTHIPAIIQ